MATKRETRQHSQLSQHGEYWHVSVSERQRSRLCGQNLRVPFLRTVLPPEVGESARAMAAMARQKRSYLYHQGEFQHNYFDFVSLHHSEHDGVVRISVRHSEIVKRFNDYIILYYITRHNFSYTRSVITRHNFSYTRSVITLRGTIFPIPGV